MPTLVVVGAQWGDEAKGKVVDLLCADAKMVVRFTGGNNAGHTVLAGDHLVKFHLLPAGMLRPATRGVLTSGMVICPKMLVDELDELGGDSMSPSRLLISRAAHVVLPYHSLLDGAEEQLRGSQKLGTTRRGIGPAYADKAARFGMRMAEFVDDARRNERMRALLEAKNEELARLGLPTVDVEHTLNEYAAYAERLRPLVGEAEAAVADAVASGERVLFEGAHGTLLDIDLGTYPYVTSTHTSAGSACIGTGIGPLQIDHVLGVVKAYQTRVGEGPMPTELHGSEGETIRERGQEYGTSTGRPRRCGWLDLVALVYSARVNGLDMLALTRLDVLTGFDELKVCTHYRIRGSTTSSYPTDTAELALAEPVYEALPGWNEDVSACRQFAALPEPARRYVELVSKSCGVDVALISVGAERDATILCRPEGLWATRSWAD